MGEELEGAAGGDAGGPGPLEVVAAEPAGDVDDLADEVEAGDVAALHGAGVEFELVSTPPAVTSALA